MSPPRLVPKGVVVQEGLTFAHEKPFESSA